MSYVVSEANTTISGSNWGMQMQRIREIKTIKARAITGEEGEGEGEEEEPREALVRGMQERSRSAEWTLGNRRSEGEALKTLWRRPWQSVSPTLNWLSRCSYKDQNKEVNAGVDGELAGNVT